MRVLVRTALALLLLLVAIGWVDASGGHPRSAGTDVDAGAVLRQREGALPSLQLAQDVADRATGLFRVARQYGTVVPEPSPAMVALRDRLAAAIGTYPGEYAISVLDLQTGERIDVNGDRRQLAGCTNKIFLMIALAQDMERGLYTPASVAGLVEAAMGPSYTPPARELIRIVGGGDIGAGVRRINALAQELGAERSLMTHPPGYYGEEYGYGPLLGEYENWLTTNDLNRVLAQIYQGKVLPPEWTEYVLWSMTIGFYGPIQDGVPWSATVYHKIGQLYQPNNVWNDAGIVVFQGDDGQPHAYAISFLGQYSGDTFESRAYGGQLSAMVYQYFDGKY